MMRLLYNFFSQKINFSEEIINSIKKLNNIKWCSSVGNHQIKSFQCSYNIIWCNEKKALEYLALEMDKENIICLENIFLLGNNILSSYLSQNDTLLFDTEWNKVVDEIHQWIDFNQLQEYEINFQNEYSINHSIQLYLNRFVTNYIQNLYFLEKNPNIPTNFPIDIFDIYANGHIVVGWKGKPLSANGHLLVF